MLLKATDELSLADHGGGAIRPGTEDMRRRHARWRPEKVPSVDGPAGHVQIDVKNLRRLLDQENESLLGIVVPPA